MSENTAGLGAYGFQISGMPGRSVDILRQVPRSWPRITVQRHEPRSRGDAEPSPSREVLEMSTGGFVDIDPALGAARFRLAAPLGDDEIVHPGLAVVASRVAEHRGWNVLHGGLLSFAGRGVAVLGERGAGKSTLLAWTALRAEVAQVLSDDLVIVDGSTAFAGPRSVDLRPDAATRLLGDGDWARTVRGGERSRLTLPLGRPSVPLSAIVVLTWGTGWSVTSVPATQRLLLLDPHTAVSANVNARAHLLALASHPLYVIHRPRTWDGMEATLEILGDLSASSP